MMNEIDSQRWQQIRGQICLKLNHQKNHRTLDILATTYGRSVILPLPPSLLHTHIQKDIERCIFIAYIHTYINTYLNTTGDADIQFLQEVAGNFPAIAVG